MALPKTNGKLPSQLELEPTKDLIADSKSLPKKPKSSPQFAYFLLALTTIISLSFWIYRDIRHLLENYSSLSPKIQLSLNLDSFKFITQKILHQNNSQPNPHELELTISKILKNDLKSWGFYLENYPKDSSKTFYWSKNSENLNQVDYQAVYQKLKSLPAAENSFLTQSLPDGSQIHQTYDEDTTNLQLQTLITLPSKEILLIIRATSQISPTASRRHLPDLVHAIYWAFAGLN